MSYRTLDALRTIKVLPGDLVLDVEMVTIQTTPTGITAAYGVPIDSYLSGAGADLLGQIADGLESLVTHNHVIGGVATQQLDTNGFIADTVDLTVAYVVPGSGVTLTGVATVPTGALVSDAGEFNQFLGGGPLSGTPADIVDAEYARLQGLAGG